MRRISVVALVLAAAAVAGCGTTRENRYNETPIDHDVVYRTPAYGDPHYYDDDDVDVVYVRPAYRLVPATRGDLVYGGDGYYYYRE